jgi:hypothetical protein
VFVGNDLPMNIYHWLFPDGFVGDSKSSQHNAKILLATFILLLLAIFIILLLT